MKMQLRDKMPMPAKKKAKKDAEEMDLHDLADDDNESEGKDLAADEEGEMAGGPAEGEDQNENAPDREEGEDEAEESSESPEFEAGEEEGAQEDHSDKLADVPDHALMAELKKRGLMKKMDEESDAEMPAEPAADMASAGGSAY